MRLLILAVFVAAMSSAGADVYRWTDSSGKTHFTDTPPPASARSGHKHRGIAAGQENSAETAEPYVVQLARKNYPVKLYSAPGCGGGCEEARALLNARGVPFTEVSVSSELALAELKEATGSAVVPVLFVGSLVQKGFEQGAYHRSLDAAGYPKTGALPRRMQSGPKAVEPPAIREMKQAEEAVSPRGPYAPRSP